MTQYNFSRDNIKETLQNSVCKVKFTKVNGEERTMTCTLIDYLLPEYEAKVEGRTKKENLDNLSVWDLDFEQWRSFKVNNIIDLQILLERNWVI